MLSAGGHLFQRDARTPPTRLRRQVERTHGVREPSERALRSVAQAFAPCVERGEPAGSPPEHSTLPSAGLKEARAAMRWFVASTHARPPDEVRSRGLVCLLPAGARSSSDGSPVGVAPAPPAGPCRACSSSSLMRSVRRRFAFRSVISPGPPRTPKPPRGRSRWVHAMWVSCSKPSPGCAGMVRCASST